MPAVWSPARSRARDAALWLRSGRPASGSCEAGAGGASGDRSEVAQVYLRPLGLIEGNAAPAAVEAGWALPLGGGEGAFTACEVWQRRQDGFAWATLPAAELSGWIEQQPDPLRRDAARRLERLLAPPSWPDGLPRRRPLLMGVVNVTPDSFSDGGAFLEPGAAIAHGLRLRAEGADVVDVGGESTRPGAAAK